MPAASRASGRSEVGSNWFVARPAGGRPKGLILAVDITTPSSSTATRRPDYQLFPGDRIFVHRLPDAELKARGLSGDGDAASKTEKRLESLEKKMDELLRELRKGREPAKEKAEG